MNQDLNYLTIAASGIWYRTIAVATPLLLLIALACGSSEGEPPRAESTETVRTSPASREEPAPSEITPTAPTEQPVLSETTPTVTTEEEAPANDPTLPATGHPALPERSSPRPQTTGSVPHTQIGVEPLPEIYDELIRRTFELPDVENRPTIVSLPGTRGVWINDGVPIAHPVAIVSGREFIHIHPDGSLHAPLPFERAIEAVRKGWAERHPWADERDGWDGFVLLYTPRSTSELDVVVQLIVESYNYVTGREIEPSPTTTSQAPVWEEVARWGDGDDGLRFQGPNGIAIDKDDNVYTTEFMGHRVRKFNSEGDLLAEWGGRGNEPGQISSPTGIVFGPDGRIYVAESAGHRVQVFSPEGTLLDALGARGDGDGEFASAMSVALDHEMRVYVTDWGNSRVQIFDNTGQFLSQIAEPGTGQGELAKPTGVAIGPENDLWVMDRGNDRIQRFERDGTFVQLWTQAGNELLNSPTNITFDKDGNWWVSEFEGNSVMQFSPDGELLFELAPGTFRGPHMLLFDSTGALYVADTMNGVVRKFRRSE